MTALLVAIGSAMGGVGRYLVSRALNASGGMPYGTLAVNLAGSLAIGVLSGWLARHGGGHAAEIRAFAVIGICGGFTTFSTFSNETFRLLENSQWAMLAAYVAITLVGGLFAVWLGYLVAR